MLLVLLVPSSYLGRLTRTISQRLTSAETLTLSLETSFVSSFYSSSPGRRPRHRYHPLLRNGRLAVARPEGYHLAGFGSLAALTSRTRGHGVCIHDLWLTSVLVKYHAASVSDAWWLSMGLHGGFLPWHCALFPILIHHAQGDLGAGSAPVGLGDRQGAGCGPLGVAWGWTGTAPAEVTGGGRAFIESDGLALGPVL